MTAPTARYGDAGRASGIVTPEAVLLEFSEAGLGSRSLGFLVDLAVRGGFLYALVLVLGAGGVVLDDTLAVVLLVAAGFSVLLVYPVVCETIWNGRTPGKMALGLRVVTVEGAPVRFRHAAIRSALGIVDFVVGAGAVAILCALATPRSQRVGDLAAGTIVVRERQATTASVPIVFRPLPGWEPFASALDVSPLREEGYVLVRSFLLRVGQLRTDARAARGTELRDAVSGAIGVDLPPGTDPEGFLVAVAAAYQQRHEVAPPPSPPPAHHPGGAASPWQDEPPPAAWGSGPPQP